MKTKIVKVNYVQFIMDNCDSRYFLMDSLLSFPRQFLWVQVMNLFYRQIYINIYGVMLRVQSKSMRFFIGM